MSPGRPSGSTTSLPWLVILLIPVVLVVVTAIALTVWHWRSQHEPSRDQHLSATSTEPAHVAVAEKPDAPFPIVLPPRSSRPLQVFDYGWFSVGYDNERRAGAWGRYELDGPITHRSSQPPRPTFRMETRSSAKVTTKDYTNPGNLFERAHIVPSYAMWSRFGDEARKATFVMVNAFPQDGDLNGRLWEDIEDDIAGQAKGGVVTDEGYAGRLRGITVIAGPVYRNGNRRLPSGIPIPDACFTVIYDVVEQEKRLRARAYLIENRPGLPGPPSRYATTLRAIEEATGFDFMPGGGAAVEALERAPAVSDPW